MSFVFLFNNQDYQKTHWQRAFKVNSNSLGKWKQNKTKQNFTIKNSEFSIATEFKILYLEFKLFLQLKCLEYKYSP